MEFPLIILPKHKCNSFRLKLFLLSNTIVFLNDHTQEDVYEDNLKHDDYREEKYRCDVVGILQVTVRSLSLGHDYEK